MVERRKNGLYFGCGAKWAPGHKCRRFQLYQILLDDLQEETECKEFVDCLDNHEELLNPNNSEETAEFSLNVIQGTTGF